MACTSLDGGGGGGGGKRSLARRASARFLEYSRRKRGSLSRGEVRDGSPTAVGAFGAAGAAVTVEGCAAAAVDASLPPDAALPLLPALPPPFLDFPAFFLDLGFTIVLE